MTRRIAFMDGLQGVAMATALMMAARVASTRQRASEPRALTEREIWNADVDARKAEKKAAKLKGMK